MSRAKEDAERDWPKVGERWDTLDGQRTCRVMGVVEGYVVARFKGAMPVAHACERLA